VAAVSDSPDRGIDDPDDDRFGPNVQDVIAEFETESPVRALVGPTLTLVRVLSVGLALYALYWVIGIIEPQIYRASFLLVTLS